MWHVYILKCNNGSYYIGSTHDLKERLKSHLGGYGSKFTRANEVNELVYTEQFLSKETAVAREFQLKGWSRVKKEALISGQLYKLVEMSKSKKLKK